LSFIGTLSISVMTVIITYLVRRNLSTVFVLLVIEILLVVIFGVQLTVTHHKQITPNLHLWLLLVLAGILSAIGNVAIYRATAISPNPGLVITILGLQGGIVGLLAVIFLKDKFNTIQLLGILVGILAIALIGYGSRNTTNTSKSKTQPKPTALAQKE